MIPPDDTSSKRYGNLIHRISDGGNPYFAVMSEPEFNLVPKAFQAREKHWISRIMQEAMKAHAEYTATGNVPWFLIPSTAELNLPRPSSIHPVDHFGRAWNIFTQLIEQMDGRWTWCDENGRELTEPQWREADKLNLCLKFTPPELE